MEYDAACGCAVHTDFARMLSCLRFCATMTSSGDWSFPSTRRYLTLPSTSPMRFQSSHPKSPRATTSPSTSTRNWGTGWGSPVREIITRLTDSATDSERPSAKAIT